LPPEPIAITSSSGSTTSPAPEMTERRLGVGDDEQRFQPAQHAVGAPVFCECHRRPPQAAVHRFELLLEFLEQRECVGRRAGEPGEHFSLIEASQLARVLLQDRLSDRHLPVAGKYDLAAMADRDDRRAVHRLAHVDDTSVASARVNVTPPRRLRARECLVVDLRERAKVDVRCSAAWWTGRRGRELLIGPQVGAAIQEMGRERMTEGVRARVHARPGGARVVGATMRATLRDVRRVAA